MEKTPMTWPGCGAGFVRDDSPEPAASQPEQGVGLTNGKIEEIAKPFVDYQTGYLTAPRAFARAIESAILARQTAPTDAGNEDAQQPIMFGDLHVENMQIDLLALCLKQNSWFDGDGLEKAWNQLVAFYLANRKPTAKEGAQQTSAQVDAKGGSA